MSNPDTWNNIWGEKSLESDFAFWLKRESQGVRGAKIENYIKKHLGRPEAIKIIEVGSGLGVYSFIFARQGAMVTLMDYSRQALLLAEKNFDQEGLRASFLLQDALDIPGSLRQGFDLAMSFGTVEHFKGRERFIVARAHFDLVRPGGVVIISVPNRLFFPHQILNFFLHRKNKWPLGYERSFGRRELLRLAQQLGLEDVEVRGSSFIADFIRYVFILGNTGFLKSLFPPLRLPDYFKDRSSAFDDLLGADIFLMGRRPPLGIKMDLE